MRIIPETTLVVLATIRIRVATGLLQGLRSPFRALDPLLALSAPIQRSSAVGADCAYKHKHSTRTALPIMPLAVR
jgi:hypothetical protein